MKKLIFKQFHKNRFFVIKKLFASYEKEKSENLIKLLNSAFKFELTSNKNEEIFNKTFKDFTEYEHIVSLIQNKNIVDIKLNVDIMNYLIDNKVTSIDELSNERCDKLDSNCTSEINLHKILLNNISQNLFQIQYESTYYSKILLSTFNKLLTSLTFEEFNEVINNKHFIKIVKFLYNSQVISELTPYDSFMYYCLIKFSPIKITNEDDEFKLINQINYHENKVIKLFKYGSNLFSLTNPKRILQKTIVALSTINSNLNLNFSKIDYSNIKKIKDSENECLPLIIFSFNFNSNKNLNKIDDLNKYIELYFKLLENNYYENLNKEKTNENKLNSIINSKIKVLFTCIKNYSYLLKISPVVKFVIDCELSYLIEKSSVLNLAQMNNLFNILAKDNFLFYHNRSLIKEFFFNKNLILNQIKLIDFKCDNKKNNITDINNLYQLCVYLLNLEYLGLIDIIKFFDNELNNNVESCRSANHFLKLIISSIQLNSESYSDEISNKYVTALKEIALYIFIGLYDSSKMSSLEFLKNLDLDFYETNKSEFFNNKAEKIFKKENINLDVFLSFLDFYSQDNLQSKIINQIILYSDKENSEINNNISVNLTKTINFINEALIRNSSDGREINLEILPIFLKNIFLSYLISDIDSIKLIIKKDKENILPTIQIENNGSFSENYSKQKLFKDSNLISISNKIKLLILLRLIKKINKDNSKLYDSILLEFESSNSKIKRYYLLSLIKSYLKS